jgi:hypothetical protein
MWKHSGKTYYFSVNICLDFPTVIRDATPTGDAPIIYFVPMCSPDNPTFHTYADTVLWEDSGRAVFLGNCVGSGCAGGSSLFAVTPTGARLRPAVALSNNREAIAVVDLHCDRLVPPKRSGSQPKGGVGEVFYYHIQTSAAGVEIVPAQKEPTPDALSRGVLNPALFGYLGKQLRMTFLGVEGYGSFDQEKFSAWNFELYSVLGHHDVMVTHLHHDAYALLSDVDRSFAWKNRNSPRTERESTTEERFHQFPYFEVSAFHKVLGVPVPVDTITAFDRHTPTFDEIRMLLDLGMDWTAGASDEGFRNAATKHKWILAVTKTEPGQIDAVMTSISITPTRSRDLSIVSTVLSSRN